MTPDEQMVKKLYAAIVLQALKDFTTKPSMREEIEKFFKSDWGKHLLDVLEIKYSLIQEKYEIAETNRKHREFMRQHKAGLNDSELALALRWSVKEVKAHRKEYSVSEGGTKIEGQADTI